MHDGFSTSAAALEARATLLVAPALAAGADAFSTWQMYRLRGDDIDSGAVWESFREWALANADASTPADESQVTGWLADLWSAYLSGWCNAAEREDVSPWLWGYVYDSLRGEWVR